MLAARPDAGTNPVPYTCLDPITSHWLDTLIPNVIPHRELSSAAIPRFFVSLAVLCLLFASITGPEPPSLLVFLRKCLIEG